MENPPPAGSDVSAGMYRYMSCGLGEYGTVAGGDSVNDPYTSR